MQPKAREKLVRATGSKPTRLRFVVVGLPLFWSQLAVRPCQISSTRRRFVLSSRLTNSEGNSIPAVDLRRAPA